jgi:hypothetical protein
VPKRCTSDTANQNLEFDLGVEGGWRDGQIAIVILCDIRRELKKLNTLLHCSNFTDIPPILRGVRKNTTKRRPKKKA